MKIGDGREEGVGQREPGVQGLSLVSGGPLITSCPDRPGFGKACAFAFLTGLGGHAGLHTGRTTCGSSSLSAKCVHYIPVSGQPASYLSVGLSE